MALPIYVAMTAAEYTGCGQLPANICWMACHFSSYSAGLSNLPASLPVNSILMLNDQYMPTAHDPAMITNQLQKAAKEFQLKGIILDMQRPPCALIQCLCVNLRSVLPCPVAVTPNYANNWDGPVFIPPIPPNKTAKDYLSLYNGNELWLELDTECTQYIITETGCRTEKTYAPLPQPAFKDAALNCHYHISSAEDTAIFTLVRTETDQQSILSEAEQYGAQLAVQFYRKF